MIGGPGPLGAVASLGAVAPWGKKCMLILFVFDVCCFVDILAFFFLLGIDFLVFYV
jgi:hypothetical protein